MLGVCDCEEVEYDDRGRSRWYYSLVDDVNVNYLHPESVQEMLVDVLSGTEGEEEQDDNEGTDIQVTNISRTLAGEESNGEVKYCECGRALTAPESVKSGKCKPCRDKMMAGYDQ